MKIMIKNSTFKLIALYICTLFTMCTRDYHELYNYKIEDKEFEHIIKDFINDYFNGVFFNKNDSVYICISMDSRYVFLESINYYSSQIWDYKSRINPVIEIQEPECKTAEYGYISVEDLNLPDSINRKVKQIYLQIRSDAKGAARNAVKRNYHAHILRINNNYWDIERSDHLTYCYDDKDFWCISWGYNYDSGTICVKGKPVFNGITAWGYILSKLEIRGFIPSQDSPQDSPQDSSDEFEIPDIW